jgi:hypothetical protein
MKTLLDRPMTDKAFRGEFLQNAKLPSETSPLQLVNDYRKTRSNTMTTAIELGIGEAGLAEIRTKAASAFLKRWMMTRFATVDLSFTSRKWYLKIERDEKNIVKVKEAYTAEFDVGGDPAFVTLAEVDRFFQIDYDLHEFAFGVRKDRTATQRCGSLRSTRKHGGMSSLNLSVSAVLPDGIGEKQVHIAQEAMGHYHLARSLCYTHGIDLQKDIAGDNYYRRDQQKVKIIWGPNVDVLTVTATPPRPAGDPAIILALHGENYLLDFYDTPDETPISNLIREFSEGKLSKMKV